MWVIMCLIVCVCDGTCDGTCVVVCEVVYDCVSVVGGVGSGNVQTNEKTLVVLEVLLGKALQMEFSVLRILQKYFKILVPKATITLCFCLLKTFCSNFKQNFA